MIALSASSRLYLFLWDKLPFLKLLYTALPQHTARLHFRLSHIDIEPAPQYQTFLHISHTPFCGHSDRVLLCKSLPLWESAYLGRHMQGMIALENLLLAVKKQQPLNTLWLDLWATDKETVFTMHQDLLIKCMRSHLQWSWAILVHRAKLQYDASCKTDLSYSTHTNDYNMSLLEWHDSFKLEVRICNKSSNK